MSADAFAPARFPHLGDTAATHERERARRRGYAEGHAEGFRAAAVQTAAAETRAAAERAERAAAAQRAVDEAIAALQRAAEALNERTRAVAAATKDEVFAHAVELAAVIIAGEVAHGSTATAVRRVWDAADPADVREVRLHPADLAALEHLGAATHGVTFTADDTLVPGDALAVLDDGFIDARIETALERARHAVAAR